MELIVETDGCVIVANYVDQLDEEEAAEYTSKANVGGPVPVTTYNTTNYGVPNQYAFAQPTQSYGVNGSNNV